MARRKISFTRRIDDLQYAALAVHRAAKAAGRGIATDALALAMELGELKELAAGVDSLAERMSDIESES